jgi:hypothetical protein
MADITNEQWAAIYQKVFLRYHELQGHAILRGNLFDEMNNLRLMVNAYNAGGRTQNLYSKMKAAVE